MVYESKGKQIKTEHSKKRSDSRQIEAAVKEYEHLKTLNPMITMNQVANKHQVPKPNMVRYLKNRALNAQQGVQEICNQR